MPALLLTSRLASALTWSLARSAPGVKAERATPRSPHVNYIVRDCYTGPGGVRHDAAYTFEAQDAEAWLADERRLLQAGTWVAPKVRAEHVLTFGTYAEAWPRDRTPKPRTRQHYRSLLDRQLLPTFAHAALSTITPEAVRVWHATTATAQPTLRAYAYGLMRTILASAVPISWSW